MLQTFCHYFLHFGFVAIIAYFWDKDNWWRGWLLLLCTMVVDLDHLVADPIFDPSRCSIGYHYLHAPIPILVYLLSFIFIKHKWIRLFFLGLLFHMLTDLIDCFWMFSECRECWEGSVIYDWMIPFI